MEFKKKQFFREQEFISNITSLYRFKSLTNSKYSVYLTGIFIKLAFCSEELLFLVICMANKDFLVPHK